MGLLAHGCLLPPLGEGSLGNETTSTASSVTTDGATTASPETTTGPGEPTGMSSGVLDTSSTGASPECARNSDCTRVERCDDAGTCVALLSGECQILEWPEGGEIDDVVFVGSIMPTSPPFANLVQPLENAIQLAIEDFNQETTLQGDRRIAWVGCDDTAGTPAATTAATHLATNVGVAAIIGPYFDDAVLEVASDVAIDSGTFMMAPAATAMSISGLPDDNLVWRTMAGDVYQSNAIVDRFVDLDNGLDPDGLGGLDAAEVTNLLILAKDDAYGNGIYNDVLPDLQAALPDAEIYSAVYPDPTTFDNQKELLAAYGAVLAAAASDPAHDPYYTHVLFVGTSEIQALLYLYLGVVWQVAEPMPLFTVTHGAVPEIQRFIEEIGPTPGTDVLEPFKSLIESRLQGTSPVALNPENFAAFSVRYRIRFNDEEPLLSSALSYDATLSTLLAMSSIDSNDPITGAAIAASMPRLVDVDGDFISFSGSDLAFVTEARNALATADGSVDLQGVSGELQWDLSSGDVRADVWGWDVVDASNPPDGSEPVPQPTRIYLLDPAPATEGTWVDIPY